MKKEKKEKTAEEVKPKSRRGKRVAKYLLAFFLLALFALVSAFIFYAKDYQNKTLPNTYFLNQEFSGISKKEVITNLEKIEKENKDKKIKLSSGDKSWEISFEGLGWTLEKDKLQEKIYSPGHQNRILNNIWPLLHSLWMDTRIEPIYTFNEKLAQDWLEQIKSEISTPKQEANIQIKYGKVKIIEPQKGRNINEIKIKKEMLDFLALKKTGEIKFDLIDDEPVVTKEDAEGLKDKAVELSNRKIELVGPKGSVFWNQSNLGLMIEIKKNIAEEKSFLKEETYGDPYVSFNQEKISNLLEEQSSDLNNEPVDARFELKDGKVSLTQSSVEGKVVDLEEASKNFVKSLEAGKDDKIELTSKVQQAAISAKDASDIEKFGIKELIGSATTDFSKSPSNRVHNIQTGTKALSGALIKPGDEFSTIGHLGQIDATSGYLQELVIKGNETKPEFGGGLCQVSTTLFRAAMNSGLKITERQNHSYRVSYYEPPVGMDATIYYPKPDLKFVNDTSSYILVQGRVDGYKITFDFFGTKDGRSVEITEPQVYDITQPPPDIYIDDPTLAPGEVKRIDRAHNGAKASFTYRVTKDGKTSEQVFTSEYVPWAAKYLRGPGDAPAEGQ